MGDLQAWEAAGVPEAEARVYEALVPRPRAAAADLTGVTGLAGERLSRILSRLVHRGLVHRLPGRPARYAAVDPNVAAATLIAAREEGLRRLGEHARTLTATHRHRGAGHPAELIEVIEGPANVRAAFVRLQRGARREMRVFDKPPYTGEQPEGNPEEYDLLSQGTVCYRTLYERAALTLPGRMTEIWQGIRHGERARVAGELPMKMALSDDQLAIIPVSADQHGADAAYLVHPSSLLDALSALFEALWLRAVPLNNPAAHDEDRVDGRQEVGEQDRELLGLLASGATDETIGRTLGWSLRTVHRHVHKIMAEFGAGTRFQAGMEAAHRGWV